MSETELKNWGDLNFDERTKVLEAYQNTEDRNESDKVAPREEDVKDYGVFKIDDMREEEKSSLRQAMDALEMDVKF